MTATFAFAASLASILLVPDKELSLVNGMFLISSFGSGLRTITGLALILSIVLVRPREEILIREKLLLMLSLGLGLNLLCLSSHFLITYLGLELASISAWALTSFGPKAKAAALKYFVFGAAASASMVYGMSWLYGLTGSLNFTSPEFIVAIAKADAGVVVIAFGFVLMGLLYKISAMPMHFWAPEVYQAAPLPVVALFSTAPKIASLGLLWHLIVAFGPQPACFGLLCLIAALTLTIANFAALNQQSFRKLMAWSSISQTGFLISALLCGTAMGREATLIYALFYVLANVCVFELIRLASKDPKRNADYLPSLAGLGLRNNKTLVWGVMSLIALLSLVGLPPTAGFTAKLIVFTALLEQYQQNGNWWVLMLLILGLLNTVIALFYYLRIPYLLFLKAPTEASPALEPINLAKEQALPKLVPELIVENEIKTNPLVLLLCTALIIGFLNMDLIVNLLQIRINQ